MASHSSRKTRSDRTASDMKNILSVIHGLIQTMSMPDVGLRYSRRDLERIDHELHTLVALVRGVRNAKQQIHALPPEILTSIFSHCQIQLDDFIPLYPSDARMGGTRARPDHKSWLKLLHVCRRWRAIIAQSPQLWSMMDLNVSPRMFLDRSQQAPLIVYAGIRETWYPQGRLIRLLNRHSHRIEQLHMTYMRPGDASIPSALNSISGPAHLLTSLTLDCGLREDVEVELMPALFNDQYPSLKNLVLRYYSPPYSMRNLVRVCLYDQPQIRENLNDFLTFLEYSPCLRELTLVNAGPDYHDAHRGEDTLRVAELSHLEELMLGAWMSPEAVARFLSHISLPKMSRFFLWGPNIDFTHHLPHDLSLLPNLRGLEKWCLNRDSWPKVSEYHQAHGNLFGLLAVENSVLYSRGPQSIEGVLGCAEKLGLKATLKDLSLREAQSPQPKFSSDDWSRLIRSLPSLERVSIYDFSDYYSHSWQSPEPSSSVMLEALTPKKEGLSPFFTRPHVFALHSRGRKKESSGLKDVMTIPCPKLHSVSVHHEDSFRVLPLQSMVTIRGQCGYKLEQLDLVHREFPHRSQGGSLYSRDEIRELEHYVTKISFSRRNLPIAQPFRPPFVPPMHYAQPTIVYPSYSPTVSTESILDTSLSPKPPANQTEEELPPLPPSWPTPAMKWTYFGRNRI